MKNLKQVFTVAAFVVAVSSNGALHGFSRYAAVWYNKKTQDIQRLIGDMYMLSGEDDVESLKNIKEACQTTGFKPFWISQTSHYVLEKMNRGEYLDSEKLSLMELLTFIHCFHKAEYKKNVATVKKHLNTFSNKDFTMPRFNFLESVSPCVVDLRKDLWGVVDADSKAFGIARKVYMDQVWKFSSEKQNIILNAMLDNALCAYNDRDQEKIQSLLSDKSLGVLYAHALNGNAILYKTIYLEIFRMQLNINKISLDVLCKTLLGKVGNQLMACQEYCRRTKNYEMFKALKDLYTKLEANLLISKKSRIAQFIQGSLKLSSDDVINEIAQAVDSFIHAVRYDLADFGLFAKMIQTIPFIKNSVVCAHDSNICDIEDLLTKSGYERVWVQAHDVKKPLSKDDCQKFFTIKPQPTVDSKIESVVLTSKL